MRVGQRVQVRLNAPPESIARYTWPPETLRTLIGQKGTVFSIEKNQYPLVKFDNGGTSSSPVAATRRRVKVEVECSACGGRGQLNCGSLGTVDCEVCNGSGKHSSVD